MEYFYLIFKIIFFYILLRLLFKIVSKEDISKLNLVDSIFLLVISYFLFNILNGNISLFYGIFIIVILGIIKLVERKFISKNKDSFTNFFDNIKSKYNEFIKDKEDNIKANYKQEFPLVLILDGDIDYDALDLLKKDKIWLESNLDCDVEEIFYAFYNNDKLYIIKKRDFRKL